MYSFGILTIIQLNLPIIENLKDKKGLSVEIIVKSQRISLHGREFSLLNQRESKTFPFIKEKEKRRAEKRRRKSVQDNRTVVR